MQSIHSMYRRATPATGSLCLVLLSLLAASCDHDDVPTAVSAPASFALLDGANGGAEGFYFMPPMVRQPEFHGTFAGEFDPVVDICATPDCTGPLHATFTTAGSGPERVRASGDHYVVNWNTRATKAIAGETYRVRVSLDGSVLGYADVLVAAPRSAGGHAGEAIVVNAGQTLPIRFRIETGMPGGGVDPGFDDSGFIIPPVTVISLSHQYWNDEWSGFDEIYINDGVYFGTQSSPLGSYISEGFSAAFEQGDIIRFRIRAPAGKRFQVTRHPDAATQYFGFNVYWTSGLGDSCATASTLDVTFEDLAGPAPANVSYSRGSMCNAGHAFTAAYLTTIDDDFSFTSMTVSFPILNAFPVALREFGTIQTSSWPSFYSGVVHQGSIADMILMQIVPAGS